jgi:hypothetical protein
MSTVEMTSDGTIFIPRFMRSGSGIQVAIII